MLSRSRSHTRGAGAPPGFFCGRTASRATALSIRHLAGRSAGKWLVCLVIPVLASDRICRAEEHPLDPIVVTEEPIDDATVRAPTAFVTPIDVTKRDERVETVADALAEAPGVQVRRFGGLGAFTTLSVRGSSANQVRFFLDGIPLSPAQNETVNVADLPLDSLERIDVYRGTAPVGFGTGGIGGVVNLVTRRPSDRPLTTLGVSYGSFDTRKVAASHTRRLGGVDLLGYVTYLGSEGDFEFEDDNGTPLNPLDDRRTTRKNNDFNSVDGLLKGGANLADDLRLEVTSENFFKDQGVPGIGSSQSTKARLTDLRFVDYARLTRSDLIAQQLDASATVFGSYDRSEFFDPEGDLGTGNQDRCDETTLAGGQIGATAYPFAGHILDAFSELSHERFSGSNQRRTTDPNDPDQKRLHLALALQDQAPLFDERLLLVPTVRYEHLSDEITSSFTPVGQPLGPSETVERNLWSYGGGLALTPIPWLTIKGNLGYFERAPSFSELFGIRGSVAGNNDLRPETAVNRDIGAAARYEKLGWIDRVALEYAYFNNDVDDIIVLVQNSQRVSIPENISAARLRGHEVALELGLLDRLRFEVNYTNQDAENRSGRNGGAFLGNQLPGRPEEELHGRVEVHDRRGRLYYELDYISDNFLNESNFDRVPSRDIHTLGISAVVYGGLIAALEVQNFTDNTVSDVAGFPLPGLAFFGTLTFKHPSNTGGSP